MERPYLCPDCGFAHDEPADARLGHRVPCLDCAIGAGEAAPSLERPEHLAA